MALPASQTPVPAPAPPGVPVLRIEDLTVELDTGFGPVPVVDGVTLALEAGQTLALVGESGCGKSLLARAVLGVLPARVARVAGGRVLLGDTDLATLRGPALRSVRGREIALVFQEPGAAFNPVLTVGDHIIEAIRAHEAVTRPAARQRAEALLGEVGIAEPRARLDAYPHQLSGGMRQRAMLALALACRPTVLVADEPTTALDVSIQAQIVALLRSLQASRRMALWLITHDLSLVARLARRVAVMYAGRIVEQGTVDRVLTRPAHPYTSALLASLPDRRAHDGGARLAAIPGHVPPAGQWPGGCRFRTRCPFADATCAAEVPPLRAGDADDHAVACHHPRDGSDASA